MRVAFSFFTRPSALRPDTFGAPYVFCSSFSVMRCKLASPRLRELLELTRPPGLACVHVAMDLLRNFYHVLTLAIWMNRFDTYIYIYIYMCVYCFLYSVVFFMSRVYFQVLVFFTELHASIWHQYAWQVRAGHTSACSTVRSHSCSNL